MKKTTQLRNLLHSDQLEFLLEAHNGMSAKIVEEAGFKGIWASGLGIAAQLGVRDNNEASWTQVLEIVEFMADATSVPILLDGDTGYGNFNNMRRLVKKLEQRQIAGVCIEDKQFPKTNSFIHGTTQPLAEIEEFCGKIKAAKDAQFDDDFVVVARIEAFIAGWGLSEALKRAEAYTEAGADAILIHSALNLPDEVLSFKQTWGDRAPILIVPTKYYLTPTSVFQDYNFSIAIWANQMLRASVTAMQHTATTIYQEQNLFITEDAIVPITEIFRLQDAAELITAEQHYLPHTTPNVSGILLAASRGIELGKLTDCKPKCMLELQGQPLLSHIAGAFNKVGIKNITVVRGYQKQVVNLPQLHYVDNDRYETTGELVSLFQALQSLSVIDEDWIIGYGDGLFKKYILQLLLEIEADFAIVVDADWHNRSCRVRPDYVVCSLPNSTKAFYTNVVLEQITPNLPSDQICGLWTGLLKVSYRVQRQFKAQLTHLLASETIQQQGRMPLLINELVKQGYSVQVIYITGHWLDVDEIEDMLKAGSF